MPPFNGFTASRVYGLVTLTTTASPALTEVPGGGSILTTVQLAGNSTMLYFWFAEDNSTLVRPRSSSFCSAIFPFCPVTSGIVIEPGALAVDGALLPTDGAPAADGTVDAGLVTVTVDGFDVLVLPQAAAIKAIAQTDPATRTLALTQDVRAMKRHRRDRSRCPSGAG